MGTGSRFLEAELFYEASLSGSVQNGDKNTKNDQPGETRDDTVKSRDLYKDLCWKCSKERAEVKLLKCSGCKTARYCGDKCRDNDWADHGSWCERKQRRREEKREQKGK